jgi:hypothetical protein
MMSGHLSQKPFEVYFGKDKDGNEIYANWSFSGMPGDVVNLCRYIYEFGAVGGPMFIAGKMAFWPRMFIQVVTGKTYFGAMYRKGLGGLASTLRTAWFAITSMMPFSTSTPLQMVMGKEREYSLPEYLSNIIMGGRTRHTPPEGYEAVRSGYKYGTLKKVPETEPRSLADQVLSGRPFKPTMQQLRHMDLRAAVDAMEGLSDAEKLKYKGIIMMKYGNLRRYSPDVRRQIIQKMNDEGILTGGGLPPPPQ